MSKQISAVEWFYEEIWKQFGFSCSSNILEQAKEMEKQQIIEAVDYGKNHSYDYSEDNEVDYHSAEQYYNETFKSE